MPSLWRVRDYRRILNLQAVIDAAGWVEPPEPQGNMQCEFPGPLIGDVMLSLRTSGTIDVVDREKTFTGTLCRCPQ